MLASFNESARHVPETICHGPFVLALRFLDLVATVAFFAALFTIAPPATRLATSSSLLMSPEHVPKNRVRYEGAASVGTQDISSLPYREGPGKEKRRRVERERERDCIEQMLEEVKKKKMARAVRMLLVACHGRIREQAGEEKLNRLRHSSYAWCLQAFSLYWS